VLVDYRSNRDGTIFAKFFYGIFGVLRVFSLDLQTLVVVGV